MITIDIEALASALADRLQRPSREWLTLVEAAEHVRVSERWLRDRLNEVPHVRVDRKLLFDRQELDAWLLTNHRR